MSPTSHWALAEGVHHLNHGSYGATPKAVLEAQRWWRDELESNPTAFFAERYLPELRRVRARVAEFVGAETDGLVMVPNATTGVAAAVRAIDLRPGDRVVTTDHAYNACRNILDVAAAAAGAEVVAVPIRFPGPDVDEIVSSVLGVVDDRTRVVVLDHLTSASAIVLPVERIVTALEPDVPVVVDGAHAPGAIDLDVGSVGASWYTGNLHKWVCAPKGAAFLVTAERHRDRTLPGTISHGWNTDWGSESRHHRLFDWTGTRDPTAWLAAPDAIEVMACLDDDGWDGVRRSNRALALAARDVICDAVGIPPPVPDELLASMAAIPLPDAPADLAERLRTLGFVVAVNLLRGTPVLRVSAQRYNTIDEYVALAAVL